MAPLAHHRGRTRHLVTAVTVLIAGVALTACSHPPNSTTTSTSVPSTAPTTTTPVSSTTSSTALAASCSTGVLRPSSTLGGSAAGSSYATFTVTNEGPSACSLEGYPKIAFFGASGAGGAGAGALLQITTQDSGATASPVTLPRKGSAEFLVTFSDVPAGGFGCSTVASVQITPPNSGESLPLPVSVSICGGSARVQPFAPPGSESP